MHYILDNEGYVEEVSFGGTIECKNNTCSEYTGKVPEGYDTLENWFIEANIRAYKVVDGDLVLDANRDYKLRILYEQEANENRYVTRKELGIKNTSEVNPYANLFPSKSSFGPSNIDLMVEETEETGDIPVEEVDVTLSETSADIDNLDLIEIEFIGKNFLPNTATNTTNNGVRYRINIDKTIIASGTATEKSTMNLAGTDTSVRNVLTLKKSVRYMVYGFPDNVNLELYNYDGTDRTLIGTYANKDIISSDKDINITQAVISIDSGTTINETITPILQTIGMEYPFLPMTKYESSDERNGQYYVDGGYAAGTYYAAVLERLYQITLNEALRSEGDKSDRLWINYDVHPGIEIVRYDNTTVETNIPYSFTSFAYEEYKNNTTLIDLTGNEFTTNDKINIKDNQIVLIKNAGADEEYIFLGNVPMPRCYTPMTKAYSHQDVQLQFKYKDPRNLDMSKVSFDKITLTNSDGTYNFISGNEIGGASSDGMRWWTLTNFEGENPYLILDNDFEEGGGQTTLSSTGLSISSENASIKINGEDIFSLIYPVGSIYMSVNSTNPATLFGGTWVQLKDRFLLGAGTSYTAGDTGGEANVTLKVEEIPSHSHVQNGRASNSNGSYSNVPLVGTAYSAQDSSVSTDATGGGSSHNNMPPYLVVYMWKRTA